MPSKKKTSINQACTLLAQGDLVVMPTETVYGLAADALNGHAVAKIYELKKRPQFNPLIIHVSDYVQAQQWAYFTKVAEILATYFWHTQPSPLTLVLNKKPTNLSSLVTAGLETVAIRVPHHPVALDLLKAYGKPLAAPSANRSLHISPTTTEAVHQSLGPRTPFILDGGPCQVGLESTILDLSGDVPVLLRPGGTPVEMLEEILGHAIHQEVGTTAIKAPGMMKRHYAPQLPLRINCLHAEPGEAFLGFGHNDQPAHLNLSKTGDLKEAAANLFSMLNELDKPGLFKGIAVMPIPLKGLGAALNDRLQRAASSES
nr:L-threonylcarbamoyladenylate synthase [Candidatus Finniella inopinata]